MAKDYKWMLLALLYRSLKCTKSAVWMQGSTHGYVPPNPQKISWKDNMSMKEK